MPVKLKNALSARRVQTETKPGSYADGGGLELQVREGGNKTWTLRVMVNGKRVVRGLGSYPAVGLADARALAVEYREALLQGIDLNAEVRAEREAETKAKAALEAEEARIPTFSQVAEQVIQLRRPTWTSDRHAEQWTESLRLHAFPGIGHKRIDAITTADTLNVVLPIWVDKAETATRVRQRMETIFDFAVVQGWRPDNPANGSLSKALPRRPRQKAHHPALPYAEVPAALAAVRGSTADPATRLSFEFLVLTAARAGEVREAYWSEIDWENAMWTVPGARMKARREHRVPLADRAMAVLAEAWPLGDGIGPIFPSKRSGKPISDMAFSTMLKRLGVEAVPHGFRSSFRDWVIEQTSTPWAVGEAALAHNLGNSVESAYARTDVFDRRRVLMQEWSDYTKAR